MAYMNNFAGIFPQQSYGTPYPNYSSSYQQPQIQVVRVNGKNGAMSYNMPPNSSILLLDESAPVVWLKTTDGAGYPSITGYSITPIQDAPRVEQKLNSDEYSSLDERITKLEKERRSHGSEKSDSSGPRHETD